MGGSIPHLRFPGFVLHMALSQTGRRVDPGGGWPSSICVFAFARSWSLASASRWSTRRIFSVNASAFVGPSASCDATHDTKSGRAEIPQLG